MMTGVARTKPNYAKLIKRTCFSSLKKKITVTTVSYISIWKAGFSLEKQHLHQDSANRNKMHQSGAQPTQWQPNIY